MDIIGLMGGNIPTAVIVSVVIGLFRNVLGWLENALQDGVISAYEWKLLVQTIVKYFTYVMVLMVGLPLEQAVVGAFFLDAVKSSLSNISAGVVAPVPPIGGK